MMGTGRSWVKVCPGWGALLLAHAGVIAFLVMTWRENYKPLALIAGALVLGLAAIFVAQASGRVL